MAPSSLIEAEENPSEMGARIGLGEMTVPELIYEVWFEYGVDLAARRSGIERAAVYLVADEGFGPFAHCLVEEVAQSLGPANDDDALAGSIFNDRSEDVGLRTLDFVILNVLYDTRIRPGMTRAQVLGLEVVLADGRRAWERKT